MRLLCDYISITNKLYGGLFMFKDFVKGSLVILPAPSFQHEVLKEGIVLQIGSFLKSSPHRLFTTMSVSLSPYLPKIKELKAFQKHFRKQVVKGTEQDTYLIPDIFVAFEGKKEEFGVNGYTKPPKWVIEILSPSTALKDLGDKKELYRYIGVEEYWVISDVRNVFVFLLKDEEYQETEYSLDDEEMKGIECLEIPVSVFPDLKIKIEE